MIHNTLHLLSIREIQEYLRHGRLTSVDLTHYYLERINRYNSRFHAFTAVDEVRADLDAQKADQALLEGIDLGPLHGIPYALKDIIDVANVETTCHSKLMLNHYAKNHATLVKQLIAGGAVYMGKLATHEFALGGPSEELPFPPARNPWNPEHFTGASSSGAGAAIAAGLIPVAIGSDTSGSIRGPACLCGVTGFKPTYGLVSRVGVFPLSWSMDHCGPLTRYVDDVAQVMSVICGVDPEDPASVSTTIPFYSLPEVSLSSLRVAWPRHLLTDSPYTHPEVIASLDHTTEQLQAAGASVEIVSFPNFSRFNACGRVIMTAESFVIHQNMLKESPEKYGKFTFQRIIPGAVITAAELLDAQRVRAEMTSWLNNNLLSEYDVMLFPSTLRPAPKFDEFGIDWPPSPSVVPSQTIVFNVTGNPALNLPTGLSTSGLPIGMQLVGRLFDDARLLAIGQQLEKRIMMPALELS
ncbi:amidase [Vibrio ruber]|uniref:amidase n=1 Tax=Vibrio ruber TaxID=184755 RepID=UPI00289303F2|nr:amidase [Vibrio ruber]WNJ97301.1 amidase [Vibrio ruber]